MWNGFLVPGPRGVFFMKTIGSGKDWQPFGIVPRPGEGCGLMYRMLFDATERGR